MTKVLVTGGAGFIGSHLCEKLAAMGFEVLIFDNLSMGSEENVAIDDPLVIPSQSSLQFPALGPGLYVVFEKEELGGPS